MSFHGMSLTIFQTDIKRMKILTKVIWMHQNPTLSPLRIFFFFGPLNLSLEKNKFIRQSFHGGRPFSLRPPDFLYVLDIYFFPPLVLQKNNLSIVCLTDIITFSMHIAAAWIKWNHLLFVKNTLSVLSLVIFSLSCIDVLRYSCTIVIIGLWCLSTCQSWMNTITMLFKLY